eukprot:7049029-Karenia_brevis.AAC.1
MAQPGYALRLLAMVQAGVRFFPPSYSSGSAGAGVSLGCMHGGMAAGVSRIMPCVRLRWFKQGYAFSPSYSSGSAGAG